MLSLDDGVHGQEPWISDGTFAGTHMLEDARPGPFSSSPSSFVPMPGAGRLFFVGNDDSNRRTPSYLALELRTPCPARKLCLHDGRFEVETSFTTATGSGAGLRSAASDQAGFFTFFSPGNWEVMVKVLDGCAINQHFWVFAAAATDVEYEIKVTDTESGEIRTYRHEGGAPAPATADIAAFATCAGATP